MTREQLQLLVQLRAGLPLVCQAVEFLVNEEELTDVDRADVRLILDNLLFARARAATVLTRYGVSADE